MTVNKEDKCPFCGITDMLGVYHSKREAYDHYLPKGIYPFNSINFRNLVPACHYCNSSYKTSKDVAFTPKDPVGRNQRRKVFYPYATSSCKCQIEITIDLNTPDIEYLAPSDVQLTFGSTATREEVDTWKDVYGIEERYKAKCCSKTGGKFWAEELRTQCDNYEVEPKIALANRRKVSENSPFADSNFLRVAFLEGCHRIGLWT